MPNIVHVILQWRQKDNFDINNLHVKDKERKIFFLISSGIAHKTILYVNRSPEVQLWIGKVRLYVFRLIICLSYFNLTILYEIVFQKKSCFT